MVNYSTMTQRKFNSLPPGGGYRPKGKTVKKLEQNSAQAATPNETTAKSRFFDFTIAGEQRYAKRIKAGDALSLEACALLAFGEVFSRTMLSEGRDGEALRIINKLTLKEHPSLDEEAVAGLLNEYQQLGYIALHDGEMQLQPAALDVLPENTIRST